MVSDHSMIWRPRFSKQEQNDLIFLKEKKSYTQYPVYMCMYSECQWMECI